MSIKPPPGLSEDDYEAIEDAVMETARGRWFLREYARRARAADTGKLLEALTRIERLVGGQAALPGGYAPEEHAQALEERQGRFSEIAWTLRERGYDGSICAMIENEAKALARLADSIRGAGPIVEHTPAPAQIAPPNVDSTAPVTQVTAPGSAESPQRFDASVASIEVPAVEPPERSPVQTPPDATVPREPESEPAQAVSFDALVALDALGPREKAALFS